MSEFARALAVEQRKRLVGSLMDHLEKQVYPHLPRDRQVALRQKVLQSVGVYHDFVVDCLKATVVDGTTITNEALLEKLDELHREVTKVRPRG